MSALSRILIDYYKVMTQRLTGHTHSAAFDHPAPHLQARTTTDPDNPMTIEEIKQIYQKLPLPLVRTPFTAPKLLNALPLLLESSSPSIESFPPSANQTQRAKEFVDKCVDSVKGGLENIERRLRQLFEGELVQPSPSSTIFDEASEDVVMVNDEESAPPSRSALPPTPSSSLELLYAVMADQKSVADAISILREFLDPKQEIINPLLAEVLPATPSSLSEAEAGPSVDPHLRVILHELSDQAVLQEDVDFVENALSKLLPPRQIQDIHIIEREKTSFTLNINLSQNFSGKVYQQNTKDHWLVLTPQIKQKATVHVQKIDGKTKIQINLSSPGIKAYVFLTDSILETIGIDALKNVKPYIEGVQADCEQIIIEQDTIKLHLKFRDICAKPNMGFSTRLAIGAANLALKPIPIQAFRLPRQSFDETIHHVQWELAEASDGAGRA